MPDEKIRICRKCKSKQLIQEYPKAENWIGFKCLDCGFRWMYDTTRDSIYSEPSNFITMEEANNPLTKDYEKLKEEQSLCGEPDCLCNTWPGNEIPKNSEVTKALDSFQLSQEDMQSYKISGFVPLDIFLQQIEKIRKRKDHYYQKWKKLYAEYEKLKNSEFPCIYAPKRCPHILKKTEEIEELKKQPLNRFIKIVLVELKGHKDEIFISTATRKGWIDALEKSIQKPKENQPREEQSLCGEPDCLCNTWPGNEKPKDSEVADKQDSEIIYAKESFMDLQKMLEQQKIIIGDLKLENKSHQITVNSQDKEIIKYKRYYEDLEYKNKEIEQLHIDISGFEAKYKKQMENLKQLNGIITGYEEGIEKEVLGWIEKKPTPEEIDKAVFQENLKVFNTLTGKGIKQPILDREDLKTVINNLTETIDKNNKNYQELKENYLKEIDKKNEMKIFIRELSDQNSWPEDSPWKQKYNKIMEVEY